MLIDAYGNPIGEGRFYIGPDENPARALIYYARGYGPFEGGTHFILEDSRGTPSSLEFDKGRTLFALSDDALIFAINSGRVTIEDKDWFKKRSGKTIKNNRVVE